MDSTAGRTDAPTQSLEDEDAGGNRATSLLVIEELSSRRLALPNDGVLTIGRSPDADIRIDSAAVSRLHAKLILATGEAQIADLGSHNGTLVNGEQIQASRTLSPGDVVTIGETTLVLRAAPSGGHRQVLGMDQLRRRVEEEIARAAEYLRPFALVALRFDTARQRAAASSAVRGALRRMDFLAADGASFVALLPELESEAARSVVAALLEVVAPWAPDARGGVASYPSDGGDSETLLAGARGAAAIAAAGASCVASEAAQRHTIGDHHIVIADVAMVRLYELIRRLASSGLSVLILGEMGTGKENAAAALHYWSPRAAKPFIALNCAALPETLVESELFGYERGAFSDARQAKPGLLERANGGTVFLDEVADLPPAVQVKLLRVLERRRLIRLGDLHEREIDIRIVAATNRDLDAEVRAGRFRSDLLFRLNAAVIQLPPLRHRRREVPMLARHFVESECARRKRPPLALAEATLALLAEHDYPGNIRELKNAMEYAVATADSAAIHPWNLPPRMRGHDAGAPLGTAPGTRTAEAPPEAPRRFRPVAEELRELERARMVEALDASDGVQRHAAAAIGMPVRTFTFKLKQYGIVWCEPKRRP